MKPIWRVVLIAVTLVLLAAVPSFAEDGRVVVGGTAEITPGNPVNGDMLVVGGSVDVQPGAEVYGDVLVVGGHVGCAGSVFGSVFVLGGDFDLEASAVVDGDVFALGGNVSRSPGAEVRGEVRSDWASFLSDLDFDGFSLPMQDWQWRTGWGWNLGAFAGRLLTVVLAVLAVVLVPGNVRRVRQGLVASPWAALGAGFLVLVVAAIVGGLLIITLCLAILGGVIWLAAWLVGLLGFSALGMELGERLLRAFGARTFAPAWAVLLGCFVLVLLTYLPCCIGWLIWVVLASVSLGSAVLSQLGMQPRSPAEAA